MGRNLEKDAIEMAAKDLRILENGFRIFSEKTIEKVTMSDVAEAAGIAISSLYRYYNTKPKLVMAVNTFAWKKFLEANEREETENAKPDRTGAEMFKHFLDTFIDLYKNHKDLLRFSQFFNIYLVSESISEEEKQSFMDVIQGQEARFARIYRKGKEDGTIRTDLTEKEMFSSTMHLMLAVVTRYAVGLAYNGGTDPEEEIKFQKELLMQKFVVQEKG